MTHEPVPQYILEPFLCTETHMASTLPTLAPELIDIIASNLESTDLFALRLVCKIVSLKAFHSFGRECFNKIQTDLSYKGLQQLTEISKHEGLRHQVQSLLIRGGPGKLGQGFIWTRHTSGHLVFPSPGFDQLRSILLNLTNCRSFQVYPGRQTECFDEPKDLRPSDAVAIVLRIIFETASPVRSLCVTFSTYGEFTIDARQLRFLRDQGPKFISRWAHGQDLFLEHTLSPGIVDSATGLVLRNKDLHKLHIESYNDEYSVLFINRLCSADTLPRLRSLSLDIITIPGEILSKFILRFGDSLHDLSLKYLFLENGTWASVFAGCHTRFPLLERISFTHLYEAGSRKIPVMFPAIGKDPVVPGTDGCKFKFSVFHTGPLVGATYEGPQIDTAFKMLAKSAVNYGTKSKNARQKLLKELCSVP